MYAPATDPLLLNVYGCCASPSRWPSLLEDASAEFEAYCAVVYCVTIEQDRLVPYWSAYNPSFDMAVYQAEISDARNPRMQVRRSFDVDCRRPVVLVDDDLFTSDETSMRNAMQGEFRRIGLGNILMGLARIDADRFFTIAVFRNAAADRPFNPAHRQRLESMLPHFAQAMSLTESVTLGRSAATLVHEHLDRWPKALVLCDSSGRIQWVNRRADLALRARGALQINQGVLQLSQSGGQSKLLRAISDAVASQSTQFLAIESARGRLQLALQPLSSLTEGGATQLLVSFVNEGQDVGLIPAEALRALFDFTNAEANLASALVSGVTVEQYAQSRGVTVGTVRTQLNQVLSKSGAHRQADLVRRVLCSAAAALPGESSGLAMPVIA